MLADRKTTSPAAQKPKTFLFSTVAVLFRAKPSSWKLFKLCLKRWVTSVISPFSSWDLIHLNAFMAPSLTAFPEERSPGLQSIWYVWQEQMQLYQELVLLRLWPSVTSLMWQIIEWKESEKGGITSARERLDSPHFCIYWPFLFQYTISYPDLQPEMAGKLSGALLRSVMMVWILLETDFIKQSYVAWHLM